MRIPYRVPASTQTPSIVPRLSWGADDSIRRAPPVYAPALRFAVVHHTAGRTAYTQAEAPAIVKAIQLYHVRGNGWNDIGYNFLVDRFGTIYEGRFGGIDRNVVGAHALGFNTGSAGVAVLGTYGDKAPPQAAQDALARLLAWRLDLAHVDPLGVITVKSGGSERYASGVPVQLRAISGHRDTGLTECPGDALYGRLASLAGAAAKIGQPKIFEPVVTSDGEGGVRFTARVSRPLAWTVAVSDFLGNPVAGGSGTGTAVDWTWDSTSTPAAAYKWAIAAGAARPATGSLRAGTPTATTALTIEGMLAEPAAISPNGDQQADESLLTFSLTAPATVTVEIVDAAGSVVTTVLDGVSVLQGRQQVPLDAATLPDGSYTVVVRARGTDGTEVESVVPLTISRLLGRVSVAPAVFSPNGDGRRDTIEIGFDLAGPATVRVRVLREDRWVATPLVSSLPAGPQHVVWDGSRSDGQLRDGSYQAVVEASGEVGATSFAVPFASDTHPPRARIVSLRPLRVEVSEPAVLHLRVNGVAARKELQRAGVVTVRWPEPVRRARVVAWDAAGNASAPIAGVAREGSKRSGQ
jgi:hypothetical protein